MINFNHAPRRLVYVDLENLTGSCSPTETESRTAANWLKLHLGLQPQDHVVVAGDMHNALAVGSASKILNGTMRLGFGQDGADLSLLREAYATPRTVLESRYSPVNEVVIGSGDGIFTPLAEHFRALGLTVIVVSIRGSLSLKLATASTSVIYFDQSEATAEHDRNAALLLKA